MQYANIGSGKIIGITSMALDGLVPVPDDARLGDFIEDGKAYTPPNSYSMLSAVEKGAPVWVEDIDAKNEEIDTARRAAYVAESDPLFFKEQRGEVDAGTWAAKVAEIKARYPKTSA